MEINSSNNTPSPKVALVANTSWSIYNFRKGVIRFLVSKGCEVHVLAPRDAYSEKLISLGVHFIDLPLANYSASIFKDFRLYSYFKKIYKQERYSLVFHYTLKPILYGSIAAAANGIDSIAVTTGLGRMFQFDNKVTQYFVTTLYKRAARAANEVWFLNDSDRERLVNASIVPSEKTVIVPSEGIDVQHFKPLTHSKASRVFRVLLAGRLLVDKGVVQFVEAARILKERNLPIKCELLGFLYEDHPEGVNSSQVEKWQEEGVIKYLGVTEDVRPFIHRSDIAVLPSFYQEGISRILLECASMATPTITTDRPGCKEVVRDQRTGLLISSNDPAELADAITTLFELSDEDLHVMGQLARKHVKKHYREELILEEYERVVQPMISMSKVSSKYE